MIKYFKKVRLDNILKNKMGEYYKYAIGEIFFVVFGILIAMGINNWNEERKVTINENNTIKNIVDDLKLDSVHIQESLGELHLQLKVIDEIIAMSLNKDVIKDYSSIGLLRFSSDFRPITQKNHSLFISNMKNEQVREKIQNYFLKEDEVLDMFIEYVDIIHNKVRPFLSETGMHNLESLYDENSSVNLKSDVLISQLSNIKFQQLLYERRLKSNAFENLLSNLKTENEKLVNYLNSFDD